MTSYHVLPVAAAEKDSELLRLYDHYLRTPELEGAGRKSDCNVVKYKRKLQFRLWYLQYLLSFPVDSTLNLRKDGWEASQPELERLYAIYVARFEYLRFVVVYGHVPPAGECQTYIDWCYDFVQSFMTDCEQAAAKVELRQLDASSASLLASKEVANREKIQLEFDAVVRSCYRTNLGQMIRAQQNAAFKKRNLGCPLALHYHHVETGPSGQRWS